MSSCYLCDDSQLFINAANMDVCFYRNLQNCIKRGLSI
jgi:hypothetical protein